MANNIVLLGCGRMGRAMLRGWMSNAALASHRFFVVDPKSTQLRDDPEFSGLSGSAPKFVSDAFGLPDQIDIIVVALKPQKIPGILPLYQSKIGAGTLILSIAAGTRIDTLQRAAGRGDCMIVRAMPNLPASIGRGITVCFAKPDITKTQKQSVQTLLESLGQAVWIDQESYMDAVTAVSGSGPAYVFRLCEAMADAGIKSGLPADLAMQLARQTIIGSGFIMDATEQSASELRQNVTSPGGTTQAALDVMNGGGAFDAIVTKAVAAAVKRGKELAES